MIDSVDKKGLIFFGLLFFSKGTYITISNTVSVNEGPGKTL